MIANARRALFRIIFCMALAALPAIAASTPAPAQGLGLAAKKPVVAVVGSMAASGAYIAALYATGKGVTRDLVEAYVWVSLAVNLYPQDEPHRPDALQFRSDLAVRLKPEDLLQAQQRVDAWKPRPASAPGT